MEHFTILRNETASTNKMPLFSSCVCAGFPSPADDYVEKRLDLNELLIKNSAATFFVKVTGESMIGAGINDGDILIVDKSKKADNNNIVIAVLNGELTVKRVQKNKNKLFLIPANDAFKKIEVTEDTDFIVWGVVTNVIHQL
ncbi:MAG: translesion error-prone DNA polymerase V autoproteolytic subunit [Candidatus Omnitrophica bacterium]|nr:translesion error-prone DNA polymerase V autoproteolytic subunit [Candidatus Omnitrophota bacterium]